MKTRDRVVGIAQSVFGMFLTVVAGVAIGMANMTYIPAVSVLTGSTMAVCGYLFWMWGLRHAGMVSETNRWLK